MPFARQRPAERGRIEVHLERVRDARIRRVTAEDRFTRQLATQVRRAGDPGQAGIGVLDAGLVGVADRVERIAGHELRHARGLPPVQHPLQHRDAGVGFGSA